MKGKIAGIEEWSYDEACAYLDEAGLRLSESCPWLYKCEAADAVEVIAVLESFHEVEFSQTEHNRLARMMARGFIGRNSFVDWIKRCNTKKARKPKTHEMPLFKDGGAE